MKTAMGRGAREERKEGSGKEKEGKEKEGKKGKRRTSLRKDNRHALPVPRRRKERISADVDVDCAAEFGGGFDLVEVDLAAIRISVCEDLRTSKVNE